MATVLGGFSGYLDDKRQLNDAVVCIPTDKAGFTARSLRVKIYRPDTGPKGRVSAVVQGAEGALERKIYPAYEAIWDRKGVPRLPSELAEGRVQEADFRPDGCLPEIEHCNDRKPVEPLAIDPAVPSEGFFIQLSLFLPGIPPGTAIKGVVALSDE